MNQNQKHKCEGCGVISEDVTLGLDPYTYEIEGDTTLYYLCPKCVDELYDEI